MCGACHNLSHNIADQLVALFTKICDGFDVGCDKLIRDENELDDEPPANEKASAG